MNPDQEILDPYGEPDDFAASELKVVHEVKRGTGLRLFRAAFLVVLALAFGFASVRFQKSEQEKNLATVTGVASAEPPTVHVITVHRGEPTQSLALPGETAAWEETTIYARVNGYVSKWLVDIGDRVAAGQELALIDTPELDAELPSALAKLKAAEAQVQVRQAQADFAVTTEQRWRDSPKGVVSDQEREAKSADKVQAMAQLAAAKAQVALEQAEVDRLSVLAQFKSVKAPFEGTITQRRIDVGDLVTAGSTSNTTPLYRLSRDNPLRVFVHAPQSFAAQLIDGGASAEITSADDPSLRISARVTRTSRAVDPATRTMRVEIDVPGPVRALAPGMYVQVKFSFKGASAIPVPAAAMLFRSGGPQVAVIDKDDRVVFKDVTIGTDDGQSVSILSGIQAGDRVALNLSSQIAAGATVKVEEVAATPTATAAK